MKVRVCCAQEYVNTLIAGEARDSTLFLLSLSISRMFVGSSVS